MDTVLLLCGSKGFSPTVVWLPYGSSPTPLLFCGFLVRLVFDYHGSSRTPSVVWFQVIFTSYILIDVV